MINGILMKTLIVTLQAHLQQTFLNCINGGRQTDLLQCLKKAFFIYLFDAKRQSVRSLNVPFHCGAISNINISIKKRDVNKKADDVG